MQVGTSHFGRFGENLIERTKLDTQNKERKAYQGAYGHFKGLSLDQLDGKFNEKFSPIMSEQSEDSEAIISSPDLNTAHNMQERALKRAYGIKIMDRVNSKERITDKQRSFLVKDLIENTANSSIATLFLKMHGFRSWHDLFEQAGVTQDEVQSHYIDENGHAIIGFGDAGLIDNGERTFLQKHGRLLVQGTLVLGAGAVTGLTGGLAGAAGVAGGYLGRWVAKKLTHDQYVKGGRGGKPFTLFNRGSHGDGHGHGGHGHGHGGGHGHEDNIVDESKQTRGMTMVRSIVDDFLGVVNAAKEAMAHNEQLVRGEQTVPLNEDHERFKFSKDVITHERGKNTLNVILREMGLRAQENIGKNHEVGKYWQAEKTARRWEAFAGLVGGVLGGAAGAALGAKLAVPDLMHQLHSANGLSLDIDGDHIEHIVRAMPTHGGQDALWWQLQPSDAMHMGTHNLQGYHFMPSGTPGVMGTYTVGSFNQAAVAGLNPGDVILHAQPSILSPDALQSVLFQKALLNSATPVSEVFAAAFALDRMIFLLSGKPSQKFRKRAQQAVGRMVEYTDQQARAGREGKVHGALEPTSTETLAKREEKQQRESRMEKFNRDYLDGSATFRDAWNRVAGWERRAEDPTILVDVSRNVLTPADYDAFKASLATKIDANRTAAAGGVQPLQLVVSIDPTATRNLITASGKANIEELVDDIKTHLRANGTQPFNDANFDRFEVVPKGSGVTYPSTAQLEANLRDRLTISGVETARQKIIHTSIS